MVSKTRVASASESNPPIKFPNTCLNTRRTTSSTVRTCASVKTTIGSNCQVAHEAPRVPRFVAGGHFDAWQPDATEANAGAQGASSSGRLSGDQQVSVLAGAIESGAAGGSCVPSIRFTSAPWSACRGCGQHCTRRLYRHRCCGPPRAADFGLSPSVERTAADWRNIIGCGGDSDRS